MSVEELALPGMETPPGDTIELKDSDILYDGYADYWGFDEVVTFYLPDGKQFIQFKKLTEGDRARFERATQNDVKFNRRTDDAAIRLDQVTDRHALVTISVCGWNIVRKLSGKFVPVPFSKREDSSRGPGTFEQWLMATDPKIINDLYQAIRKANPYFVDDLSVEMIDEEIQKLQLMREDAVKRDALGKSS